jgi:hypothetical protein
MKNKEVMDLLKLIDRCYKTDYATNKDIVNDWFKVLQNYGFGDITGSLDNYMKNYTQYPPKVYDLIRGYQTIEEKKILDGAKTRCQFCGAVIDFENKMHEERCLSIQFIASAVKRFKNQEIDFDRYRKMSDEEFNKYHLSAVKMVAEKSNNKLEVAMWKKYLENL